MEEEEEKEEEEGRKRGWWKEPEEDFNLVLVRRRPPTLNSADTRLCARLRGVRLERRRETSEKRERREKARVREEERKREARLDMRRWTCISVGESKTFLACVRTHASTRL